MTIVQSFEHVLLLFAVSFALPICAIANSPSDNSGALEPNMGRIASVDGLAGIDTTPRFNLTLNDGVKALAITAHQWPINYDNSEEIAQGRIEFVDPSLSTYRDGAPYIVGTGSGKQLGKHFVRFRDGGFVTTQRDAIYKCDTDRIISATPGQPVNSPDYECQHYAFSFVFNGQINSIATLDGPDGEDNLLAVHYSDWGDYFQIFNLGSSVDSPITLLHDITLPCDQCSLGWEMQPMGYEMVNGQGEALLVGAPDGDAQYGTQGVVFVFTNLSSPTGPYFHSSMTSSDTSGGIAQKFGFSFSAAPKSQTEAPRVLVGAPFYNASDNATDQGAVFLMEWDGSNWNQINVHKLSPDTHNALMGSSLVAYRSRNVLGNFTDMYIVGGPQAGTTSTHDGQPQIQVVAYSGENYPSHYPDWSSYAFDLQPKDYKYESAPGVFVYPALGNRITAVDSREGETLLFSVSRINPADAPNSNPDNNPESRKFDGAHVYKHTEWRPSDSPWEDHGKASAVKYGCGITQSPQYYYMRVKKFEVNESPRVQVVAPESVPVRVLVGNKVEERQSEDGIACTTVVDPIIEVTGMSNVWLPIFPGETFSINQSAQEWIIESYYTLSTGVSQGETIKVKVKN